MSSGVTLKKMSGNSDRLIWFHGRECVHCKRVLPIVEQAKAEGIPIVGLEVWHDDSNAQLMRKYGDVIKKACGGELGVPAFYNEKTGKALCGNVSAERLRQWAKE